MVEVRREERFDRSDIELGDNSAAEHMTVYAYPKVLHYRRLL